MICQRTPKTRITSISLIVSATDLVAMSIREILHTCIYTQNQGKIYIDFNTVQIIFKSNNELNLGGSINSILLLVNCDSKQQKLSENSFRWANDKKKIHINIRWFNSIGSFFFFMTYGWQGNNLQWQGLKNFTILCIHISFNSKWYNHLRHHSSLDLFFLHNEKQC